MASGHQPALSHSRLAMPIHCRGSTEQTRYRHCSMQNRRAGLQLCCHQLPTNQAAHLAGVLLHLLDLAT